jgi:hypothetical protein
VWCRSIWEYITFAANAATMAFARTFYTVYRTTACDEIVPVGLGSASQFIMSTTLLSSLRHLIGFALVTGATLTVPLQASIFDFSYTFSTGTTASGSFQGTSDGIVVTGLTDISLSINGNQITGHIFDAHIENSGSSWMWTSGGAKAGFDILNSNFLFVDTQYPLNTAFTANFFVLGEIANRPVNDAAVYNWVYGTAYDPVVSSTNWTLTERTARTEQTAKVPEGSSSAILTLAAVAGLAAVRKLVRRSARFNCDRQ